MPKNPFEPPKVRMKRWEAIACIVLACLIVAIVVPVFLNFRQEALKSAEQDRQRAIQEGRAP